MRITTSGSNITSHNSRESAPPPVRTKNKGWTRHAAIRNRNFLYQVEPNGLNGHGFALTLTVHKCDTPTEWARLQKVLIQSLRRMGMVRYHFVTEWQKRGVPHLHGAVWLRPDPAAHGWAPHTIKTHWLRIAEACQPSWLAQDVKPIETAYHWLRYLAKHGVRGVSNYQRNAANIPPSWKGETGRVWLKGGDWPILPFYKVEGLTQSNKHEIRRLFCRYLASNPKHLNVRPEHRCKTRKHWQNFLKCTDVKVSRFKSPTSFIPIETTVKLILSVNADAAFYDEDTGELIDLRDYVRPPQWVPPAPLAYREDVLSDLF